MHARMEMIKASTIIIMCMQDDDDDDSGVIVFNLKPSIINKN